MSDSLCLGGETQEGTMISNLPLLFADGYPTCLEKITEEQLERFVPFMIQCSKGASNEHKIPMWWPEELQFSLPLIKPPGLETKWLAILKSLVCRCYTYHGCEFMLRFCTELSQCPTPKLRFVDSWDGTTSLFNKETGRLLVTFRNENRSYDGKKDPLNSLIFQADSETLQPPFFDIYLCESCDGEFRSLKEVRDHERMCSRELQVPSVAMEELNTDQDKFLNYFGLRTTSNANPTTTSKKYDPPRIKRGLISTLRFSGIPLASPLGILVRKKLRTSNISTGIHLERIERHCGRLEDNPLRTRETRHSSDPWPVSWKSSQKKRDDASQKKKDDATQNNNLVSQKKSCGSPKKNCASHKKKEAVEKRNDSSEEYSDDWTHTYKFPGRQWRGPYVNDGLNKKSKTLFSRCLNVQVELKRLTKREIDRYTSKTRTSAQQLPFSTSPVDSSLDVSESLDINYETRDHVDRDDINSVEKLDCREVVDPMDIIIPELGPNTLYVYDGRILPAERNPQPIETEIRVPVINLCSSDEEEECEEMIITNPVECGVVLDTSPDISSDENCVDIAGVEQCDMFNSVLDVTGIENEVVNSNFLRAHQNSNFIPTQENSNFVPSHKLEYRNSLPCLSKIFTPQFIHYFPESGSEYCDIVNTVTHRTSSNIQSSYTRVPVRILDDENSVVGTKTTTNSIKGVHEGPKKNSGRSGLRNRNFNHEDSRSKLCSSHEFSQVGEESANSINDETQSCREESLNWDEENMNYHCCTNVEVTLSTQH